MEQLSDFEVNQVSGSFGVVSCVFRMANIIGRSLYYAGMNAREAGQGDAFLEAVRYGNFGA